MRSTPIFLLVGAALLDCADLASYPVDGCGNRVVETNEDCDDAADKQCVSCRLTCDEKLGFTTCPDGWGCGTDKICRQKTGVLKEAKAAVSANVTTLQAGDFDADGRIDIVGSPPFGSAGGSRVHYFDRDANLSSITTLDVSISIPVVRDLDGDQVDDIGFAVRNLTAGAFGALAGQRDRTFSTIVFPSVTYRQTDARLVVINAAPPNVRLPGGLPACAVGVVTKADGSFFRHVCAESISDKTEPALPFAATDVIGDPKVGRIFPNESPNGSGCGDVIFRTADSIKILSPCTPGLGLATDAMLWRPNLATVSVPLPGKLVEDVYVGPLRNLDEDAIVVHVQGEPGVPKDTFFKLDPDTKTFIPASKFSAATGLPLAAGDLDGDREPDFVFRSEIRLSSPDPLATADAGGGAIDDLENYRTIKARDQLRWSAARIGRFNNDDLPDVLVSFSNSLDVDVMGNAGNGRFTTFTVRSEQIVRGITSGDFDGDRIEDVAFLQSSTDLGPNTEATLTLAFGSAVGGPEAPRTAGKFKNPRGFSALHSIDGTDNLAVVQSSTDQGATLSTTSISVLFGNGGRQQVAPLFMADPELGRIWQPVSFNIGAFTAPKQQAIISIATGFIVDPLQDPGKQLSGFKSAAWLAMPDATAVGGLAPFVNVAALDNTIGVDVDAANQGRRQLRLITAAGDIDIPKDGTDELVNMAPIAGQNAVGVVAVHTALGSNPGVLVATIPDARVNEGDPIELFDLDRDGYLDLVYIITVSGKRALSVLRGDGKGSFLSTPITTAGTALTGDAVRFAKLDAGSVTKVGVITSSQLWLVELGKDGTFHVTDQSSVLGKNGAPLTAIVGGDINGDGVPDLAVAQGGGVRVIPQRPTTE